MGMLKRSDVPEPMVPGEAVMVAAMGGEVKVTALPLPAYLEIVTSEYPGRFDRALAMLAASVKDADDKQFWTAAQWSAFSAMHRTDAMLLIEAVNRINGVGEQKND